MQKSSLKVRAVTAVAVMASFTAPMAFAADSGASAALDSILAEATDLLAKGWLIIVPITVGFIGMKLFRKVSNKAT
ncbi:major coat protein [Shewanella glacialipiscicola]|uniref:major coat protein n=1 Tax=Shewanella glacialipiscicola TaxID=614069 RepID=UPI003D797606